MKKLTAAVLISLAAHAAAAQQSLWGGNELISPEINDDKSVTFRLKAPDARRVEITGDWAPSPLMMTQGNDGIWTLRTEPFSSELWTYRFRIDGVEVNDPSNTHRQRDIGSVSDYFIIDGTPGSYYKNNPIPHGSVTRLWYPSKSAGYDRRISIYTPPGYENSGDRRYPVLYLLHGTGGDEESWLSLGRAAQILDNMIDSGLTEPMIVVMPNGDSDVDSAPGRRNAAGTPDIRPARAEQRRIREKFSGTGRVHRLQLSHLGGQRASCHRRTVARGLPFAHNLGLLSRHVRIHRPLLTRFHATDTSVRN